MKAVVFHGIGEIALDEVREPRIQEPTDAILRITASAICGTDLHMIRGTQGPMEPGTILGHEAVGIVEEVGSGVRNLKKGERVVIPSTIACGNCAYCRQAYYSQCDNANPNGRRAGTAFFGGPMSSGPFHGLQAEWARIPYANVGPVRLPDSVTDLQAICLSDIFPTGYFGAELAEIGPGDTVAVFGCGPVGLFAIVSAFLFGAARVLAVDEIPSRLDMARGLGAEVINYEQEDPVETILELTGGIGVDRAIDAVGIDAQMPRSGPAAEKLATQRESFERELSSVAPEQHPQGPYWHAGNAPGLTLQWAVQSMAKAGSLSIIGVYPEKTDLFPIGTAMNKNFTINMGNCNHRRYIPHLLELVASGTVEPNKLVTEIVPMKNALDAYKAFDTRKGDWVKVEVVPSH